MKRKLNNPLKVFTLIVCSLSFLMMTAGKCKKTNNTNNTTYFTVKFNSNGGSAVDSVRLASGSKVSKPADPTRVNYTFGGWYSDAGLTQTFDFNTPITKDITLYAKWIAGSGKISYNVTFNSNGGSAIVTQQVIAGEKATKPVDPNRDKYTFAGWYSDAGLTQAFDFNTPISKDITLYAKWTLTPVATQLSTIISNGTIPNDLSGYDMVSQQILSPYAAGAKISAIYITESGAGKQDGTSWENAKPKDSLKSSIDNISDASNNKVYLVLIGAGTYIPGASIRMKNNVGIIGGFPATGGWVRSATDTTVISGDNKYKVIYNIGGGLDNTALLYGVKITAGYSNSSGGGMFNASASPTITNVVFSGNSALIGGGMYNNDGSPILTNIIFSDNHADAGGGGGMFTANATLVLTNVVFSHNTTSGDGALNIENSSPIITNAMFINNITSGNTGGGGLITQSASPILINVAFINNSAPNATGGGIYNDDGSASSPVVVNAIFWGNTSNGTDPQYNLQGSVNYSVVQDSSRATLSPTNPVLSGLTYTAGYFMPTVSYTGTSPDNLGVYVKRTKTAPYTFYYSTDGNNWYTNPTAVGTGTATNVPADAIDLTATDIQGRPRKGRPNAGVWAK